MAKTKEEACTTCEDSDQPAVIEINFFAGSKYLLPGIKGSSKTKIPSSKH